MPPTPRVNIDSQRVQRAINELAPFFQITTAKDLSETIALQQITGLQNVIPNAQFRPSRNATLLVDTLLNTTEGGLSVLPGPVQDSESILERLETFAASEPTDNTTQTSTDELNRFAALFKVHHGGSDFRRIAALPTETRFATGTMGSVLGKDSNDPAVKKLSVVFVNTPQITPAQRNTEAITIFLNGIPQTELVQAVPYVNVQFLFGKPALDDGGRLNALSVFKLLEGAVSTANNTTLQFLTQANTVEGRIEGGRNQTGWLSSAGMELFQSPHTMVNGDEPLDGNSSLRATPVRDKFRPFLTFKSLNIDVAPSVGLFSFKTAKMEFVLHDISRLHEVSDFIRPDMYGTTEMFVEYGWSHPGSGADGNYYADILNYTRCREKYGIRNISMTMDEQRQASITLDLFMKGSNDFATETIATTNDRQNDLLRLIEETADEVQRLRERIQGNTNTSNTSTRGGGGGGGRTREIRGIQFLDAAADWRNNINLSGGNLNDFRTLLTQLRRRENGGSVSAELTQRLRTLVGSLSGNGFTGRQSEQGALLQLRASLAEQIKEKMEQLGRDDPFLPNLRIPGRNGQLTNVREVGRGQNIARTINEGTAQRNPNLPAIPALPTGVTKNVSLAKLLCLFVGLPLVSSGNYYDVQFLFYPFNKYAGFANGINTGQFVVDTKYFYEQYVKYRSENVGRSANVSLRDFTTFLANIIIDDPVAVSYGIDSLYDRINNRATGETEYRPSGTTIAYQTALERKLLGQTPDGSFRMPQINFYVEALPLRRGTREVTVTDPDPTKTILRIHVFDRQTTAYEGQASLLNASRENVLTSLSTIPATAEGETPNLLSHRAAFTQIIEEATRGPSPFLRRTRTTTPTDSSSRTSYVVDGGPEAIQEFVMKTMPYIIYGAQGNLIKTAQLTTMQDAALSSVNMLRSQRAGPLRANGEQPGGLPMSMIPVELSMTTMGCSLISFGQQFFVRFGTGTTADNIYGVRGLTHKLEPGVFETDVKFVPLDAYGKYSSFIDRINQIANHLEDLQVSNTTSITG